MLVVHRYAKPLYRFKIGNREIVGPSFCGSDDYFDRIEAPCPPIRFKPPSPEINALRQKEKDSWKALSIDEKKKLYRVSFRQTFAEMEAPTGEYRKIYGDVLLIACVPILLFIIMKKTVFPPMPDSMSDLGKKKMVRFYIDNRLGEFKDLWDYDKQEWKKKPFFLMKKD